MLPFGPLIRVHVAANRYTGWIHILAESHPASHSCDGQLQTCRQSHQEVQAHHTPARPDGHAPSAGEGSLCAYLRCITYAGRAAAYSTELAGQAAAEAGIAGRRPEDMVFTLRSKHIKTLDIRIDCRRRYLLTSS